MSKGAYTTCVHRTLRTAVLVNEQLCGPSDMRLLACVVSARIEVSWNAVLVICFSIGCYIVRVP